MTLSKSLNSKIDLLIYIFLGLSFTSSQLSVALSSIGITGAVILFSIKLITGDLKPSIDKKLIYLIALFFIWQLFASAISSAPASAIIEVLQKASIYLVLICSISVLDSKELLRKYFVILFVFTAIVSSYETVRYIIDFEAQNEFSLGDFRIRYFGYPITIGEIKMLVLILMLPFVLSKVKIILKKWVLILLLIPILLSLYFTNTRNAMLGLFVAALAIGIVKHRVFLIGFVLAVLIFLFAAPMPVKERILSIGDMDHPNNVVRFTMWKVAVKMIKDKPLTGFGDVDILSLYKTYKKPEAYGEGSHMHNNFFHIAVLYGIPGLIIWLALMIYIFFRQVTIYMRVKSDELLNIIVLSSIASMIAFQVSGLTEWNFGDAEFVVLLWFVLSLPFVAEKIFIGQRNE